MNATPGSIVSLALLACVHSVFAAQPLNDTGQIVCYDESDSTGTVSMATPDPEAAGFNEQDCTRGAAAADSLGLMDKIGGSSVYGRDYTKIANNGSVLPASAPLGNADGDWACTRDNRTGLIWEVKQDNVEKLRHQGFTYTWYDADSAVNGGNPGFLGGDTCGGWLGGQCNTTAFRDAVNTGGGLCGATDWRLPTGKELQSLLDYGTQTPPFIDAAWLPNTPLGNYWTGTNYAPDASTAWLLGYDGRLSAHGFSKTNNQRVRLVRGGH